MLVRGCLAADTSHFRSGSLLDALLTPLLDERSERTPSKAVDVCSRPVSSLPGLPQPASLAPTDERMNAGGS